MTAFPARLSDTKGDVRIDGELTMDGGGTLPGDVAFTGTVTVNSSGDDMVELRSADLPAAFSDLLRLVNGNNVRIFEFDSAGELTIRSNAAGAAPLGIIGSGATTVFLVMDSGAIITAAHAAPADADLQAGQLALWFDDTDGAGKLMVKAKTANGTVATGSVALA